MKSPKKLKRVNIMVEAEIYTLFKAVVRAKKRSSSEVIRGLIFEYLFNKTHKLRVGGQNESDLR